MPALNNIEGALKAAMMQACNQSADKIQELIKRNIGIYYGNYDPIKYQRTEQFLNSVFRTAVTGSGLSYHVEIYVDYNNLYYLGASGYQVAEWANEGLHGGFNTGDGHSFWNASISEIIGARIIAGEVLAALRSAGFHVN